jgi:hypothetical protein
MAGWKRLEQMLNRHKQLSRDDRATMSTDKLAEAFDTLSKVLGPNSEWAVDVNNRSWKINQLIRVKISDNRWHVWRVTGVFLGGTDQEDAIELEPLDRTINTEGRILIPREIMDILRDVCDVK